MLRRMRARIGAGIDDDIAQAVERGPYGRSGKRSAGKFRVEKFKNEVFGKAQQIGLWPLPFARSILGNRTEEHGNAVAAGLFHRAVDGARCFFRRKATRRFEGRSQPGQKPQSRYKSLKTGRLGRSFNRLSRALSAVCSPRCDEPD